MHQDTRKKRIEKILKKNFSPKILFIRDDSKKHEGHTQIEENSIETHFFIRMTLDNNNSMNRVNLHRKVYSLLDNEFASGLHALELDLRGF